MSVKHANGTKTGVGVDDLVGDVTAARNDLGSTAGAFPTGTDTTSATDLKDRASNAVEQGKNVVRRRPLPLATAAAGVATVVVTVVTIVRRRRARPVTPRQRAVNAWRSTRKSMKSRLGR